MVNNTPANAGDIRDAGLIPGLGRSLVGGHGNPFQYSCLENSVDRGAWRGFIQLHRVGHYTPLDCKLHEFTGQRSCIPLYAVHLASIEDIADSQ